jgi:hypothetical protein
MPRRTRALPALASPCSRRLAPLSSVGMTGGYLDNIGTPSQALLSEIEFADNSIGQMVAELKKRGLYQSTKPGRR